MNAHLTTDGGSNPPTYTINVQLNPNKNEQNKSEPKWYRQRNGY